MKRMVAQVSELISGGMSRLMAVVTVRDLHYTKSPTRLAMLILRAYNKSVNY